MTQKRKQITGHMLACGTQIMWGATFVSTKVLLQYFIPVEVLFTRAVLAFLAMVSWGFYSALIKKIAEWDYPTIAVTRRIYFYAILFLIPVLIVEHASWNPEVLAKPEVISNFLFLGFGASAGGFLCWNLATKWIGAVRISVYIYVSPIVTVVLSVLILHEKVTMVSVFGALLILAGLAISQKKTGGSR